MLSPEMHMVTETLDVILSLCLVAFLWSGGLLRIIKTVGRDRPPILNMLWYWTKWPALVFLILYFPFQFLRAGKITWVDGLVWIWDCWLWYAYRNEGDDDDHKKLKKKLKEKITEVGGKLVVVPATA